MAGRCNRLGSEVAITQSEPPASGGVTERDAAYAVFESRLGNRTVSEEAAIKNAWHSGYAAAQSRTGSAAEMRERERERAAKVCEDIGDARTQESRDPNAIATDVIKILAYANQAYRCAAAIHALPDDPSAGSGG